MKFRNIFIQSRKWLKRIALAYMLGFASAMNQNTKTMEDNYFKMEQKDDIED